MGEVQGSGLGSTEPWTPKQFASVTLLETQEPQPKSQTLNPNTTINHEEPSASTPKKKSKSQNTVIRSALLPHLAASMGHDVWDVGMALGCFLPAKPQRTGENQQTDSIDLPYTLRQTLPSPNATP